MPDVETTKAERLDQYVVLQLGAISRSQANAIIAQGLVGVNGEVVTKPGYKLKPSDKISINYTPDSAHIYPKIELPIIYENKDCVVIDKPAGVLSHSKGAFNPEPTVATWLAQHLGAKADSDRTGIVHRLDRDTSGVMICAKTVDSHGWLQKQFSQRKVKKTYFALVSGQPAQSHAIIDMPIERNPKKPQSFRVGSNGKSAVTEYQVVETGSKYSLVRLRPTTGRTHQLRVHLHKLGHPIVGDSLYGGEPAARLYLHAAQLEITLPTKRQAHFDAPLPETFTELVRKN